MPRHAATAGPEPRSAQTREHLLDAAAAVFTEAGFRHATVREICHRAKANIAAVNYHFGDKAALYLAVLRRLETQAEARHPITPPGADRLAPARRLECFVRSFLFRLLVEGAHLPGGRLMSLEMIQPTAALDTVLREHIQPIADELRLVMSGLLGAAATEERVRHCGISVISQCLFYHQCQDVVRRLFPDMPFDTAGIERLARHITRFSLAGIRQVAKERAPASNLRRTALPV
jgi:TetR/AcrR family transcriptional regulator, regulator of cefoperazone and chloramphenicol sensitivity